MAAAAVSQEEIHMKIFSQLTYENWEVQLLTGAAVEFPLIDIFNKQITYICKRIKNYVGKELIQH